MKQILKKALEAGNFVWSEVNSKTYLGKLRYECPNLLKRTVPLSEEANILLEELRENGVIQFRTEKSIQFAEHVTRTYLEPYESKALEMVNDPRPFLQVSPQSSSKGSPFMAMMPFTDPIIRDFVLDPNFIGIIYNFLNRQPYFTKPPGLACVNGDEYYSGACEWHTHYYHPMVVQILLGPVTPKDPHLEYIKGTYHEKLWEPGITTPGTAANNRVLAAVDAGVKAAKPEDLFMGHGEAGTVNLMDSRGFHRMAVGNGGRRDMVQLQISTGYAIKPFSGKEFPKSPERARAMLDDCRNVMEQLKDQPAHVNDSLNGLCAYLSRV